MKQLLMARGLLALCALSPLVQAQDNEQRLEFHAPVTVSASGLADVGRVQGIGGPLAELVAGHLAKLAFEPAQHAGLPVDSRMEVAGVVVLTPVESDQFDLALSGVMLRPALARWQPPDYPSTQLRARAEGAVEMVVRIAPSGDVVDSRIVSATHADFEAAARRALKGWRFVPVASHEVEVGIPFWFHLDSQASPPAFACQAAAGMAHLPGQGGCLAVVETIGQVLSRRGQRR